MITIAATSIDDFQTPLVSKEELLLFREEDIDQGLHLVAKLDQTSNVQALLNLFLCLSDNPAELLLPLIGA